MTQAHRLNWPWILESHNEDRLIGLLRARAVQRAIRRQQLPSDWAEREFLMIELKQQEADADGGDNMLDILSDIARFGHLTALEQQR